MIPSTHFEIEGHLDLVPIASRLSSRRGEARLASRFVKVVARDVAKRCVPIPVCFNAHRAQSDLSPRYWSLRTCGGWSRRSEAACD